MNLLPVNKYQRITFLFFLLFLIVSCINPPYLQFMLMQHAATILAAGLLVYLSNRVHFTRLSYTFIVIFLCLHTLGARYLYSYTPYDAWAESLIGINLTEVFDFQRNHYDRFVHFCYGFFLVIPILEQLISFFGRAKTNYKVDSTCKLIKGQLSDDNKLIGTQLLLVISLLAIAIIIATSAVYELLEWLVAIVFAPNWAESFLGLQGDAFDAQKDMALATVGAILSTSFYLLFKKNIKCPSNA